MKGYIAIFIAICLLAIGSAMPSPAQQKYIPKKPHKESKLYKLLHKKHERMKKWNAGHTEFKDRTKKDRKRMGKYHLNPYKPTKSDRNAPKMGHYEKQGTAAAAKSDGKKEEDQKKQEKPDDKTEKPTRYLFNTK
jgi:hypothetical protein